MAIGNHMQAEFLYVDKNIRLRKVSEKDYELAFEWYQNKTVMKNVIGIDDKTYTMNDIIRMFTYLSNNGELYFIEVFEEKWVAIGDVTLAKDMIPIVIGVEKYWGKGIGKKVILRLIERAKEIDLDKIVVSDIYEYNVRSQNLFKSMGFEVQAKTDKGYSYVLQL